MVSQNSLNKLVLLLALSGETVVRLKVPPGMRSRAEFVGDRIGIGRSQWITSIVVERAAELRLIQRKGPKRKAETSIDYGLSAKGWQLARRVSKK